MTTTSAKLSFGEKFGYGLGDLAANFVFQALMALQLDFYTKTFGLTAAQTIWMRFSRPRNNPKARVSGLN